MTLAFWAVVSFLVGSLPTSFLAAKYGAGVDLRNVGSGNLGATNVYRVLGWGYAIPVGLLDVTKGFVPASLFPSANGDHAWYALLIGTAAILGHVYTPFMKFRGGKGVATAAGVVLAVSPLPLLVSVTAWIVVLLVSGYVSLASIAGAVTFPVAAWVLVPEKPHLLAIGVLIAAFITFTHRVNLQRLREGTESRFGRRVSRD